MQDVVSTARESRTADFPAPSRWSRLRRRLAKTTEQAARAADPVCRTWTVALIASVMMGALPVLICAAMLTPLHQVISALVLAPVVWTCARRDDWALGMLVLATTFTAHSLTMIAITVVAPDVGFELVPDGEAYWLKQRAWITSGEDPEYKWQAWGPAHAQLLAGTTLYSLTSLGAITIHQGFYEVDLMNYYNGRLIGISRNPVVALWFGWHLWSLLRGVGYVVLTYELASLGLQITMGCQLASWRDRAIRWGVGIGFLLLDATAKWYLLEIVRRQLNANLM